MKKFYLLLFFSISLNAQVIDFPDNVFKNRLLSANTSNGIAKNNSGQNIKIDANNNGEIELTEALLVYELDISTHPLSTVNDVFDLTGISNFQNLKKINCLGNQISSLDLTELSNLEDLHCNNNDLIQLDVTNLSQLKSLKSAYNNLNTLDLTGLDNLEYLFVHSNNLSDLNINETPNLIGFICYDNNFTSLDLSVTQNLLYVSCSDNAITDLNVNGLFQLEQINASANLISSIDLSGLDNLNYLTLSNNTISDINVSNLSNLIQFDIAYNDLSELDCSQSGVIQLFCNNNPNLTTINTRNANVSYSDPDLLYFAFNFDNLPLLESICMDEGEVYNLNHTLYNLNENVVVYTGENCDIVTVVPPLSVDNFENSSVTIYPNPIQDIFSISANSIINRSTVTIFNSIGQRLKTFSKDSSFFDISDLMSGIYYLKIETDQGTISEKIIKK
jgi:Leucine-rich repeat (LRR) protein